MFKRTKLTDKFKKWRLQRKCRTQRICWVHIPDNIQVQSIEEGALPRTSNVEEKIEKEKTSRRQASEKSVTLKNITYQKTCTSSKVPYLRWIILCACFITLIFQVMLWFSNTHTFSLIIWFWFIICQRYTMFTTVKIKFPLIEEKMKVKLWVK